MNIISINNTQIDKSNILSLIKKQRKLQAIKQVRQELRVGLKEAKDIVENLEKDSTFYDGENHDTAMIPPELFNDSNRIKTSQTLKSQQKKRTPFIEKTKTNSKTYIIVFLVLCIIILSYLYMTK